MALERCTSRGVWSGTNLARSIMAPDPKMPGRNANDIREDLSDESPGLQQADWEEIQSGVVTREDLPIDEMGEDAPPDGELPEEDDDNPYMESDEALPDDLEER